MIEHNRTNFSLGRRLVGRRVRLFESGVIPTTRVLLVVKYSSEPVKIRKFIIRNNVDYFIPSKKSKVKDNVVNPILER